MEKDLVKPLYIIDFSNFVYKYKSVYHLSTEIGGVQVNTSVLYGIAKSLRENLFSDICIVLDGVPTRSLSVLPSYKGTRNHPEVSEVCVPKLEVIQFVSNLSVVLNKNVFVCCAPGQETDEVMSSIVHAVSHNLPPRAAFLSKLNNNVSLEDDRMLNYLSGCNLIPTNEAFWTRYDSVILATTDGDMIQLQRFPKTFIDTTTSAKQISNQRTSESTHSLHPAGTVLYKAIYGDLSDNIPSIKLKTSSKKVVDVIANYVTNENLQDCYNFVAATSTAVLPKPLMDLLREVKQTDVAQFKVNWAVAHLVFRSFPFVLEVPADAREIAEKYKVRLP